MTRRIGRLGHCHRCIYTWRIRGRGRPKVCPRCKSRLWSIPKLLPLRPGDGLGVDDILGPHRASVLRAARKNGAQALWIFGSVARREARSDSDVDIMVRWKRPVSLLGKARLHVELERLLGRSVDLVNEGGLHWAIEPKALAERVMI
jgi:uncharacterized protein